MNVNDLPRERVATEWDGGWFCDKCERLIHWKKKAYIINNRSYCRECAEEILNKERK